MYNLKDTPTTLGRVFLGLQGASGSGKTTAACTFPNPIVADFDNGLGAMAGHDITVVPFYDEKFVMEKLQAKAKMGMLEQNTPFRAVNRRDAFRKWLDDEAIKFTPEQTLIIDSWTAVQNAFDFWTEANPSYSKSGDLDSYAFWRLKAFWSCDVMEKLKSLPCNVVVCFHELQQRDKTTGMLTEKIQPLQDGKFVAEIKMHFSCFYRQLAMSKMDAAAKPRILDGITFSKDIEYIWQVGADNTFDGKNRINSIKTKYVKATYESLK